MFSSFDESGYVQFHEATVPELSNYQHINPGSGLSKYWYELIVQAYRPNYSCG